MQPKWSELEKRKQNPFTLLKWNIHLLSEQNKKIEMDHLNTFLSKN